MKVTENKQETNSKHGKEGKKYNSSKGYHLTLVVNIQICLMIHLRKSNTGTTGTKCK